MSEVLEMVDPSTLIVAENVRKDTKLTKGFLASIKNRGVMIPIVVDRTEAGLEVIDGQRRTLAAVEVGLKDVPVYVTAPLQGDKERIVDQLVMNDERESITLAESVAAVKQLELFGMPLSSIVKKTGYTKKAVETALAVAGSEVASKVLQESSAVSLLDAAVFVEFEDDERAIESLNAAVSDGRSVPHLAERLRQDRREAELKAAFLVEQEDAGHNVLVKTPSYDDKEWTSIHGVYADAKQTKRLTVEKAREVAPEDVFVAARRVGWGEDLSFEAAWYVRNLAQHGWSTYSGSTAAKGPLTEKEKEERRAARETTKAWAAASAVRLAWIQELVQRKTMPQGWEPLVIGRLVDNGPHGTGEWRAAIAMLALPESPDSYSLYTVIDAHLKSSPTTALQIGLAVSLAAVEGGYEFDRKGWQQSHTPAYLKRLIGWGYSPSELEQQLVDGSDTK